MSTSNRPQDIQSHLAEIAANPNSTPSGQQLVFDPTSGELLVQSRGEVKPSPDAVVADQTAQAGFFA